MNKLVAIVISLVVTLHASERAALRQNAAIPKDQSVPILLTPPMFVIPCTDLTRSTDFYSGLFKCEVTKPESTYALLTAGQVTIRLVKTDKVTPASVPVLTWETESIKSIKDKIHKAHMEIATVGDAVDSTQFLAAYTHSKTAYIIFLKDPDGTLLAIAGKDR